jgi:predicted ester cyclase
MSESQIPAEDNRFIAEQFLINLSSEGSADTADEFIAPDYLGHVVPYPDVMGPEGYKEFAAQTFTIYPDARFTIEDMADCEEGKVAIRWTFSGTYRAQGELDQAFDDQPLTMTAISILQIVDGKVTESWTSFDFLGAMQRWGTLPQLVGITEESRDVRVFLGDEELETLDDVRVFWGDTEITWPLIPPGEVAFLWPIRW